MDSIRINTAQNIDINYEVAGLGERIAARCIDLGGFIALGIVVFILALAASINTSGTTAIVIFIIFLVIFLFYDLVCEMLMNGQSVGKRVMKIKVININGSQPTFGQYLLRWLFRLIDFGIGWGVVAVIAVAISEKHQRIGDMLANTTLIKTTPRTKIEQVALNFSLPEEYQTQFTEVLHLNDREIELVHEVLMAYYQTGNPEVVYAMAEKVKERISPEIPEGMNQLQFLETVLKDYKHLTSISQ